MRLCNWFVALAFSLILGFVSAVDTHAVDSHRNDLEPTAEAPSGFDREALLAKGILTLLREHHLRQQPLDDALSQLVFDLFLKRLDPQKLYLTVADVDALRKDALALDDQFRSGQLTLARQAGVLKRQRAAEIAAWIETRLKSPFDFTRRESLETDGEKRPFCLNSHDLRERWRRVLKSQLLVLMAQAKATAQAAAEQAGSDASEAASKTDAAYEAEARKRLAKRYHTRFIRIAQLDHGDDLELFLNAFVQVYDPHTTYMPPYRKEDFDIRVRGSLEGIGALLRQEEGFLKVQRLVPGGASWRQGQLKAGDIILAVGQNDQEPVDVEDMRLRDVVRLIRGPKGTLVRLTVRKPDGNVAVIPITRDVIRLEETYARAAVLERHGSDDRLAYIHIPTFYGSYRWRQSARRVSGDVRRALVKLAAEGVDGLVLDVRGNSGGLFGEAIRVSGLFIAKGPIVQTRNARGRRRTWPDKDAALVFDGPMVVLVDRFSASASEILAAALQDYGRAVVVGNVTHGKGTVQHLYSLDEAMHASIRAELPQPLGTLKLTQFQFYRINGASTQLRGVVPDIMLPDPVAHLDTGERAKMYAVPWNMIQPDTYMPWPARWDVTSLRARSLKRQAASAAFRKIKSRTALLVKVRSETRESLNQTMWTQKREQYNAALQPLKLDETVRFTVRPIAYDRNPNLTKEAQAEIDATWIKDVQSDPWIEEAFRVVDDMISAISTRHP